MLLPSILEKAGASFIQMAFLLVTTLSLTAIREFYTKLYSHIVDRDKGNFLEITSLSFAHTTSDAEQIVPTQINFVSISVASHYIP